MLEYIEFKIFIATWTSKWSLRIGMETLGVSYIFESGLELPSEVMKVDDGVGRVTLEGFSPTYYYSNYFCILRIR